MCCLRTTNTMRHFHVFFSNTLKKIQIHNIYIRCNKKADERKEALWRLTKNYEVAYELKKMVPLFGVSKVDAENKAVRHFLWYTMVAIVFCLLYRTLVLCRVGIAILSADESNVMLFFVFRQRWRVSIFVKAKINYRKKLSIRFSTLKYAIRAYPALEVGRPMFWSDLLLFDFSFSSHYIIF